MLPVGGEAASRGGDDARAFQEFHYPLPPGSEAVHCKNSIADYAQALWQFIGCLPLPTAHRHAGSALQELPRPLATSSEAVHCKSCNAHCPQDAWQCIKRLSLPTAPRQ